jgi:hypothetical protein
MMMIIKILMWRDGESVVVAAAILMSFLQIFITYSVARHSLSALKRRSLN